MGLQPRRCMMHSMLQTLASTLLLVSLQTPAAQFKKHEGDNLALREDYYQGAERYHKRFLKVARTLPKSERDALIRSEKQALIVFDKVDTYAECVGYWGTMVLDLRPPNIYQMEEDYLNAALYMKSKKPRYLKRAVGHDPAKKWDELMAIMVKWSKDKDLADLQRATPQEVQNNLQAVKSGWAKYLAGLPRGTELQKFLSWSLADGIEGGSLVNHFTD